MRSTNKRAPEKKVGTQTSGRFLINPEYFRVGLPGCIWRQWQLFGSWLTVDHHGISVPDDAVQHSEATETQQLPEQDSICASKCLSYFQDQRGITWKTCRTLPRHHEDQGCELQGGNCSGNLGRRCDTCLLFFIVCKLEPCNLRSLMQICHIAQCGRWTRRRSLTMDRTMVRASAHSKYVNMSYVDLSYYIG